jgi:hypothetical protein
MKKHNKIILISTLFLASTYMVFAVPASTTTYPALSGTDYLFATDSYEVFSSHRAAMGGAGLGVTGFYDSYLYNPANITKSGFKLLTPTITMTVNNVGQLISPDDDDNGDPTDGVFELYERYQDGESMDTITGDLVSLMLDSINEGYGEVTTVNVRTGMKFRNFGLNLDIQDKVRSNNFGVSSATATYIDQLDIVASAAIGFNIPVSDSISVDLGGLVALNYRVYSEGFGASQALGLVEDFTPESLTQQIPLVAGYSVPITIGVNVNLPFALTYSAVARNINDVFNFTTYYNAQNYMNWDPTLTALISQMTMEYTAADSSQEEADLEYEINTEPADNSKFTVSNDWQLDMGLTWAPKVKFIKPVIAYDIEATNELFEETDSSDFGMNLLEASSIGAQISLLNLVDFRVGLNSGYKSVGAGFDIPFLFHVDAAYYFKEFGTLLGSTPSDALSIRVSLLSAK